MEDIADAYETWVAKKWQECYPLLFGADQAKPETGSEVIPGIQRFKGIINLLYEMEIQLLGASENYVNIIIRGGKFHAAFAHTRDPYRPKIAITRMELHEFQEKDVTTTIPDTVVAHFSEDFENIYKSKPSCLRFIDAELVQSYVDFLSKYGGDSPQNIPISELLSLFTRWINALITGKWAQYPESPLCSFLKIASSRYANLPANLVSLILKRSTFKRASLLLLDSSHGIIGLKLAETPSGAEVTLIAEKIIPPVTWETFPEFLRDQRKKHNVRNVTYLRLQPILELLKEMVVTPPPFTAERWNVCVQRIVNLVKNYGETWASSPPPLTVNNLFRFLTRMLGINFNLRKISYWYIPHAFTNLLTETTGGTGSILCLYHTEKEIHSLLIQLENASLTRIDAINSDFLNAVRDRVLGANQIQENAKQIFNLARQTHPKITGVLLLGPEFFDLLLGRLLGSFLSLRALKIFSASRAVKQLMDSRNFYMYPETVALQYLRKISGFKLLGWISRLFFDRHEF